MTKVIYTFLRYLLTAAGASEAMVSNDTVMQFASASVSIACALWGLYESRKHAKLASGREGDGDDSPGGGTLALVAVVTILVPLALVGAGCSTTTTTTADGSTSTTKTVDWTLVDYSVRKSVKYTVYGVLKNNPDYASAVGTINVGVAALFTGTPTEAGLSASIKAMNTNLDDADVTIIAGALKDAYDLYVAKSGKTTLLSSDEVVQGLVKAITDGIAEGVALYNTSTSTSEASAS